MTTVKKVKILGETWKIIISADKVKYIGLEGANGYCDNSDRFCIIENQIGNKEFELKNPKVFMKRTVRHEITHAFLFESGLAHSSLNYQNGWAMNEEMIDWIAKNIDRILKVCNEIDLVIDKMT